MSTSAPNPAKRSPWMDWKPPARILADSAEGEPTKPSKPGSVGFVGVSSGESPKIEVEPNPAESARAVVVRNRMPTSDGNSELHRSQPIVADALLEVAGLLANAYRRYAAIERVGQDRSPNSGNPELANSLGSSVHGGVP